MIHYRTYTKIALWLTLFFTCTNLYAGGTKRVLINEFLALNSNGIVDEDGEHSDWIELYNPGDASVNLKDWALTDIQGNLFPWTFPDISLGAGDYLLVFASDKDRRTAENQLHTNFKLSGSGEYLGLIAADGTISDEYAPSFPSQITDVSYGYYMGQATYFYTPTPGMPNSIENQAIPPVFSVERGYYQAPFTVELSVSDPETKIYYTLDGTRPTASSSLYSTPIAINTTTPLSAVGIKGSNTSMVVSHTYFFISDIIKQPNKPAGYPERWGHLNYNAHTYKAGEQAPADYEMDPTIINANLDLVDEAFLSLPTMAIVTNPGYIFSNVNDPVTGGIYIYTGDSGNPKDNGGGKVGADWERPASVEFYEPSTGKQFQINCGVRLHGGNSRKPYNSGKHGFRLSFRKEYGSGKLNFNLYEDKTAVTKFDHLVLRAGSNYSWIHNAEAQRVQAQYVYDAYAKRAQLKMGHLAPHNRFVHLFINNLYWGVYDLSEKINDNFLEAYFGGKDTDYDVINDDYSTDGVVDGVLTSFTSMVSTAKSGKYAELQSKNLLDAENFIDYLLINFYMGNSDWGKNNWFAGRNSRGATTPFRFYSWDAETSFVDVNRNRVLDSKQWGFEGDLRTMLFGNNDKAGTTTGGLVQNADFKLLFADRVQKHLFGDGLLTPENAAALYEELADEIDLSILLESARWGDYRNKVLPRDNVRVTYTREGHWLAQKENLLKNYFPVRTDILYNQLKSAGLTSPIDVPVFTYEKDSEFPVQVTIDGSSNPIYFTTNGSDPRMLTSGEISPSASLYSSPFPVNKGTTIKARAKKGTTWSAIVELTLGGKDEPGVELEDITAPVWANVFASGNQVYLSLSEAGRISIELYSIDGKLVSRINEDFSAGINLVTTPNLPRGVYLYKLLANGVAYSGKLLK
ncbi:chitobiase/beta-hexosaminidase C-terminal domain-containing protein [Bacteroidales bacterium OttesenSCG-928-J19]|nr:chitobiase/beta-hexosaminidase C-terminal domain-containing protein [Bacteroidales bacterium OttesenSCG-928-J19]